MAHVYKLYESVCMSHKVLVLLGEKKVIDIFFRTNVVAKLLNEPKLFSGTTKVVSI